MRDAPLHESAILLAALAFVAWPLYQITKDRAPATLVMTEPGIESAAQGEVPTLFQVKAAHAFDSLEIKVGDQLLGRIDGPETEDDVEAGFNPLGEPAVAVVRFPEGTPETAVTFEVWPEGYPTREFTVWGEGEIDALIECHWED